MFIYYDVIIFLNLYNTNFMKNITNIMSLNFNYKNNGYK